MKPEGGARTDSGDPGGFLRRVEETARRWRMDLRRPLALVSGGPDSVALLRALCDLGAEPVVLHVDHGLRGAESEGDAAFVGALARALGLDCEVRTVRSDLSYGANLQERAREERYAIAREVARERGLRTLATGHTSDDVAETTLMNLARGSGLRGLAGIPPLRREGELAVVRPLIGTTRAEVLAYLAALGQGFRTDSTNALPKYARNRLRHEVLPALESLYPGASRNVARTSELLRRDLEVVEGLAERAVEGRADEVVVLPERLAHPGLLGHALRLAHARAAPESDPLPSGRVEEILAKLESREGTVTLDLPDGLLCAVRFGREVAFYRRRAAKAGESVALEAGGEFHFEGWKIAVEERETFDRRDAARPEVAYLDAGAGPYRVRRVEEADTIQPLGLGGTKKVFKALMDRKVPADKRSRTPVIVGGDGRVAWIFLGETGEPFAVGERTGRVLRLEVREASGGRL